MVTWLVALVPETSIKYIMAWVGGWVGGWQRIAACLTVDSKEEGRGLHDLITSKGPTYEYCGTWDQFFDV